MDYCKEKDDSYMHDKCDSETVDLESGYLYRTVYKNGNFKYSSRPVLIGLHKSDPEFDQDIVYIQSITPKEKFRTYDVLKEYIKNRNELIFADPNTLIRKAEIASMCNDQSRMLKYLDQSRCLLLNTGFIETTFSRKFINKLCVAYIYNNDKGNAFIEKYYNSNKLIDYVVKI